MTKILLFPTKKDFNHYNVDGFVVGIENLSVNFPLNVSISQLVDLNEKCIKNDQELFVSLNKNMQVEDLELLEKTLVEIDKLNIKGIFFYDISLVTLKKELNLKTPLIWSQEHSTTNYATCNFWKKQGITYTYLSAEITLEEIKMIKEHTSMLLILPIFGFLPMFVSKRPYITNYKKHFKLDNKGTKYQLYKEDNYYHIVENNEGTTIYSSHILNGIDEYLQITNINIDYVTINAFEIEEDIVLKVINAMKEKRTENLEMLNYDKGFLYKETVYKVKNYD